MYKIIINGVLLCLFYSSAFCQPHSDKLEVLIVDGFNNHDWKQTTKVVRTILEKSGLFQVSVSTTPDKPQDAAWKNWKPRFKTFDVVIQNTNNIHDRQLQWPKKIRKRLERYVKSGGGLYILHSANNAFPDWTEYNLMIGLGWRKKEEGIAIQVADNGQLLSIPSGEGKNTFHGPRSDQVIKILTDHPINQAFPKAWKTPDMELYQYARGPAGNLTVLSYTRDEKTNINWPVEWLVSYGKGRVYNSTMGHLWKGQIYPASYRCIGFQITLIRAAEWLASGRVSYKVPAKFPTATSISLAENELNQ